MVTLNAVRLRMLSVWALTVSSSRHRSIVSFAALIQADDVEKCLVMNIAFG